MAGPRELQRLKDGDKAAQATISGFDSAASSPLSRLPSSEASSVDGGDISAGALVQGPTIPEVGFGGNATSTSINSSSHVPAQSINAAAASGSITADAYSMDGITDSGHTASQGGHASLLRGNQAQLPASPANSSNQQEFDELASPGEDAFLHSVPTQSSSAPTTGVPSQAFLPNAARSPLHTAASLPSGDLPGDLGGFSLPSEGLFPQHSSNNMDDLFGPGSGALFSQMSAALKASAEPSSWLSQPLTTNDTADVPMVLDTVEKEKPASDEDDSDDDGGDFDFDLDAQLQAAMSGVEQPLHATGPSQSDAAAPASSLETMQEEGNTVPVTSTSDFTFGTAANAGTADSSVPTAESGLVQQTSTQFAKEEPQQSNTVTQETSQAAGAESSSESDDDDDSQAGNAAAAAQFDLDAMLASAMGQASTDEANVVEKTAQPSTATLPRHTQQETAPDAKMAEGEDDDSSDDEEGMPDFDLDAQLREAMRLAEGQVALSPGEDVVDEGSPLGSDSSDEESEEEGGFDLDAQLAAAVKELGGPVETAIMAHEAPAPAQQREPASPDFTTHDLQNMLQSAMKQAALEIEEEQLEEQRAAAVQVEGPAFMDVITGQITYPPAPAVTKRFLLPHKPRTRPRIEDDGDLENAFNKSRLAHPQALRTSFACDFKGCDKVYAKLQTYQTHRQVHVGPRPFRCHLCPASFATNNEYKDHSWTHNRSREWKYRCKGCFNLFGDKGMFDAHVSKSKDPKCMGGGVELQLRPPRAALNMANHATSAEGGAGSSRTDVNKQNHDNYFASTPFDQTALLAATLVHQVSSLLARQYDRQNSLLGPNDPRIDVDAVIRQTFQRANLTANETAALATILAGVGYARNEGLKASLDEARKAQFEAYRNSQEQQRKAAIKQIKQERKRLRREAEKRDAEERRKAAEAYRRAAQEEKRKQAEALQNGDIPVPQAVM